MKIIDENTIIPCINKKDKQIKKFKFACLMADNFAKYLIYRPNWINAWETINNVDTINSEELWQKELWLKIIIDIYKNYPSYYHFSNLFSQFQLLKKVQKKNLPNRCFIFSSFSLNPSYIKILKKISNYIDIYFLHITPCKNNIFHKNAIKTTKIFSKKYQKKQNTFNHSLIELWMQYEKIYSYYIFNSKKIKKNDCFEKPQTLNLLDHIKNNMLKWNPTNFNKKQNKQILSNHDNSISIHICCDKQHEIQTLYKNIIFFLNQHSNIHPNDIVVASVSIENYISYIDSVFKSKKNKTHIPYFISGKNSQITKIILSSFNKILNLSNSRFSNEEILELLEIPEIANNFNISKEEIKILYYWIKKSNIRWSCDKKHQYDLGFLHNHQNTWFYGIKKLFLSYAMNNDKNIWNDILSCTIINGSREELIGKISHFINTLNIWRKKLLRSKSLLYWSSLFHSLVEDFFCINDEIEHSIDIIQKLWMKMINDNLMSHYEKKISIEVLKKNFFYISRNIHHKKFLPGVLNFCNLSDICYIPFKIICIIGLDLTSIPSGDEIDNFNLLIKYPLIGDFNINQKYYYLFTQSISCAQKYLYISYIGYSIKNNNIVFPSVLIDQLFNYIKYNFYFIHNNTDSKDSKKIFFYHFFKKYKKHISNNKKNTVKQTKNIIDNTYIKLYKKTFSLKNLLIEKNCNTINLKKLIDFWKNPIHSFFNSQLKIKLNHYNTTLEITEPFSVQKYDQFQINNILLSKIINNQDIKQAIKYYILSGILPYGFFGTIFLNQQIHDMKNIAKLVMKYRTNTHNQVFNVKIQDYQLHGILTEIQKEGLLRWKINAINHCDRMSLWIEHLVYSVLGGKGESKIIGCKNQIWSFMPLDREIAYKYLLKYIIGYIQGLKKPLLLIKSGSIWVDQIYNTKKDYINNDEDNRKKAYKKLLHSWTGNNFFKGDQEDLYLQKIIPKLNLHIIKKICSISEKWLIPMLKYKKNNI